MVFPHITDGIPHSTDDIPKSTEHPPHYSTDNHLSEDLACSAKVEEC